MTLAQASGGLQKKEFSSTELAKSSLQRIEATDKELHCFITVSDKEALASAKKPRKARRQSTSSLQENTMLAQSAGALAASMNDFRSFLLKAMLEFSL